MHARPVIGIVPTHLPAVGDIRLACNYADAVISAGGAPLILPLTEDETTYTQLFPLLDGVLPKLGAMLSMKAFQNFKKMVDYAEYGGAPLLGLKGIAIVCHGKSNAKAITSAVTMANTYVVKGTQQRLVETISANEELTSYGRSV